MAQQRTRRSHYISEHLTRAWEFVAPNGDHKQLRYYDFASRSFRMKSASRLYTLESPWPQQIEDFLSAHVESPLGAFQRRFNTDRRAQPTEKELKAMKVMVLLQADRSINNLSALIALCEKGEAGLDALVWHADLTARFVYVPLRQNRLLFPSTGIMAIPLSGAGPAIAVPLHPSYLVAMVRHPADVFVSQLEVYQRPENEWMYTTASIGLKAKVLVLPPNLLEDTGAEKLEAMLREQRLECRAWMMGAMSANQRVFGSPNPTKDQVEAVRRAGREALLDR